LEVRKLHVKGIPPYKQAPADRREKENQMTRIKALRREAEHTFPTPIKQSIRLTIMYRRQKGRSDAANIIGGIADALNGIAYGDDKQITQINYQETKGNVDEYQIIIEEL
jgi:Holliday junction resolvase RusA-like endonuclease